MQITVSNWCSLWVGQNSHICIKVPYTSLLEDTSSASLLSRENILCLILCVAGHILFVRFLANVLFFFLILFFSLQHRDRLIMYITGKWPMVRILNTCHTNWPSDQQHLWTFGFRDRVPFVLTSDMAYVINDGARPGHKFQHFIDLCCQAFNILRKHADLFRSLFILVGQMSLSQCFLFVYPIVAVW